MKESREGATYSSRIMIEPNTTPEEHHDPDGPDDTDVSDELEGDEDLLPTWLFEIMRPLMVNPVEPELANLEPAETEAPAEAVDEKEPAMAFGRARTNPETRNIVADFRCAHDAKERQILGPEYSTTDIA